MPLITVDEALDKTFDYVVIGGGTAGLTLSQRLSEDPTVSVLLLEAGEAVENDPTISRPGQQGAHIGNPKYDWGFQTIPQEHVANRSFGWSRGKILGGTSAINFLCWSIPHFEDINDWERLGNKGWNWQTFQKYANKDVHYTPHDLSADEINKKLIHEWDHPYLGGDLHVSWPRVSLLDVELKFQETLVNLGIPKAKRPIDGDNLGTSLIPNSLDPRDNSRSYAGSIYLSKYASRSNLSVLTKAHVTRVFLENIDEELVATGVEFYHGHADTTNTAKAKKEIIISAGALKSPQILELSGIGRPEVLARIGVPVKVDLPVGENVQEHAWTAITYQLKDSALETFDVLREEGGAEKHAELYAQSKGVFNMGFINFSYQPLDALSPRAKEIRSEAIRTIRKKIKEGKYSPGAVTTLEAQIKKIERGAPDCEIISAPVFLSGPNPPAQGKKHLNVFCMDNQMWSRGSIHSVSADPRVNPEYNPHYFEEPADLELLVEVVKFARSLGKASPLKDILDDPYVEVNPGPNVQTDEQIRDWIKQTLSSTWHTIGSASMLPKNQGGVVDADLKVYGTKNLRVADLSIAPLHVSAHTQATAYAIGEYTADIIKGIA